MINIWWVTKRAKQRQISEKGSFDLGQLVTIHTFCFVFLVVHLLFFFFFTIHDIGMNYVSTLS